MIEHTNAIFEIIIMNQNECLLNIVLRTFYRAQNSLKLAISMPLVKVAVIAVQWNVSRTDKRGLVAVRLGKLLIVHL